MASGFVRETLHFSRPATPLCATLVVPAIERGFCRASAAAGGGAGTISLQVVDGYVYGSWSPPSTPPAPPRDDAPTLGELAERWEKERVPRVLALLDEARGMAGPGASPRRVAAELDRLAERLAELFELHYDAALATRSGWATLEGALARAGDPQPALTVATLLSPTPSLLRDVEAWLARDGARGPGAWEGSSIWALARDRPAWLDVGAPTWGEDPALVARAAAGTSLAAFEEGTRRALARRDEAEAATLARFPPEMGGALRAVLGMLRHARGVAQTLNFLTGEVAVGVARGVCLRAGARLVEWGQMDAPGDVVLLTRDEARAALMGEWTGAAGVVAARREAHARAARTTPPETLGEVDPRMLEGGHLAALLGFARRGGGALTGLGASTGRVAGRARVARDEADLEALQPGEILVVKGLEPAWTSALQRAAGVVAELGGILSHAAVVAREAGKPAVVGVPEATTRIRTGERIRIDGASGEVAIEKDGPTGT